MREIVKQYAEEAFGPVDDEQLDAMMAAACIRLHGAFVEFLGDVAELLGDDDAPEDLGKIHLAVCNNWEQGQRICNSVGRSCLTVLPSDSLPTEQLSQYVVHIWPEADHRDAVVMWCKLNRIAFHDVRMQEDSKAV